MNTGVSAFFHLSFGQSIGIIFGFTFHHETQSARSFMYERARADSNVINYQMRLELILVVMILLLIYLGRRHFRRRTRVTFLSKEQGRMLFDRTPVRDLVNSYKYNECVARSAGRVSDVGTFREDMTTTYKQAILDFTPEEKRRVSAIIEGHSKLRDKKWTFMKMASYVDWGYPFTLEDVVVLPDRVVTVMGEHTVKTLEHESIHIEQRMNQDKFDELYIDRLGYHKARRIQIPSSILEDTVTNPDGANSDWVRRIGEEWFWFALKLRGKEKKPIGMAYKCTVDDGVGFIVTNTGIPLSDMHRAFDGETNTYHPNEFVASLWSRG